MNLTSLVSLLPALACPVAMGAMMWLMMRGDRERPAPVDRAASGMTPDERLAMLRAQLAAVEAEQDALAVQLGQLDSQDRAAIASREPAAAPGVRSA